MKWFVFVVALLHGLIHLLGFVKGFELKEVKELTMNISKPMGLIWLSATLFFVLFAVLYITDSKYAWLFGFLAVAISQIIILFLWKDAKFGTLPNLLILIVSVFLFASFSFQRKIQQETTDLLNQSKINNEKIITESDIENLPVSVQNWMRSSGALGRPYIYAGKVFQKAEMKLKPEQENWMLVQAEQYTTLDNPGFIWSVDVKMNSLLTFVGRDKFENGKGEMLIKLNSLINIVNERGEKLNEGTIQRYLGEMVWFPSLALSEHITWDAINDTTAKATMTYMGTSGSGTFTFDSNGDVAQFSALRFKGNEASAKRYEWVMNIVGYNTFESIKVPAKMTATWKLDEGDWNWLTMEVTDIQYNENIDKK